MFTAEEIELGKAALEVARATGAAHYRVVALRMLRDECGWTLRRADQVLAYLLALAPLAVELTLDNVLGQGRQKNTHGEER